MGETVASNHALQVSVSFGRFENDSMSWEKWSAFSPNKYLEEVEKCAAPGSVAQKKAYFEAHYKSVAARKAELLAKEKQMERDSPKLQHRNVEDPSCNTCVTDAGFYMSNTQGSSEGVKFGEIFRTGKSNLEKDVTFSRDYHGSSVEGVKENEELESRSCSSQIDKHEEDVCIEQEGSKEESPNIEAKDVKEISHNVNIQAAKEVEAKDVALDHAKVSKKVSTVSRQSSETKVKKKSVQSTSKPKASQVSTPRSSKPTSTPTKTLASASSTKRGSSPSISGRKITSTAENRKVRNKSLHMSLNLTPGKPDPAPQTTTRKSLIMEKMGDKDIVKRAFKTFQNSFNQPKIYDANKSLVKEQVPSTLTEPRIPTSIALRKGNGQSPKVDGADKKSGDAARTTLGPKSDIKAEKGKEQFPRKVEKKFNAKEAERSHLQLKSKIKDNTKTTPLPVFQRGQKVSKSHPEKETAGATM